MQPSRNILTRLWDWITDPNRPENTFHAALGLWSACAGLVAFGVICMLGMSGDMNLCGPLIPAVCVACVVWGLGARRRRERSGEFP